MQPKAHRPTKERDQLTDRVVKFYKANEKPFGAFSNLYRRPIEFEGRAFPTSEHAYQFGKPRDEKVREWLMAAPTPGLLAKTAHQLTTPWEVNPGWSKSKVDRMRAVLRAKFTQHDDLRALLLGTGDAELIEAGTIDDEAGRFWGIPIKTRAPEKCKNMLGKLLMELRAELRSEKPTIRIGVSFDGGDFKIKVHAPDGLEKKGVEVAEAMRVIVTELAAEVVEQKAKEAA